MKKAEKSHVFVHQMGKVGSQTIYRNLKPIFGSRIAHTHSLNPVRIKQLADIHRKNNLNDKNIKQWKQYSELLFEGEYASLKIITGVREPIARNVSAFFQNLREDEIHDSDLRKRFFDSYSHCIPLTWFDDEIRDVFDVDIYEGEFDTSLGWQRYGTDNCAVLVYRLENIQDILSSGVIEDFLGIEKVDFVMHNVAKDKWYRDAYRDFIRNLAPEKNYLETMLNSSYCRHFYSDDEILSFRVRWGQ